MTVCINRLSFVIMGFDMRFLSVLLVGLFAITSAHAAPIPVTNGDFEAPLTMDQSNVVNGVNLGPYALSAPGWDFIGTGGTWQPTRVGGTYTNLASDLDDIDSRIAFLSNGSTAYQSLGVTIESGFDYVLTALFGHRADISSFGGVFGFFAGDPANVIATANINDPGAGLFSLQSMTVLASSLDNFVGQELGVIFMTTAGQLNFDNVEVERVATNQVVTPLPAAIWMFGAALVAGGGFVRRRKAA